MMPWFLWNGTDSRVMGVVVSAYPARTRAEERVTTVEIPGRNGVLTVPEGTEEPVFGAVTLTLGGWLRPGSDVRALLRWLQGSGTLVLGNDPGYSHAARITQAVTLTDEADGWRSFTVRFTAEPFRRMYPAPTAGRAVTSGERVYNPGDLRVPAVITLRGGFSAVLTVGDTAVTLEDITGGILLDWESGDCWLLDENGDPAESAGTHVLGEKQYLEAGYTTIGWQTTSGAVDSAVLTLNWRFF